MWMSIGVIKEGPFCTTQAVVKQIGADGVALSSLAIAVYTFCVLVLRWNVTRYISKLVVVVIWIFIALVIVIPYIPYRKKKIYGNVGYWCWVKPEFKVLQLVTEYIWLWVSLGMMTILYVIMFTMMRGWFIVDNGVWYWYRNYRPRYNADQPVEEQEEKESKVIANMLLLYPVVYCICIVFYSIARWRFFEGSTVPHQFTLFTSTLFSLSGTVNAVLFFLTRPDLVVGHDDPSPPIPAISTQRQSFHDRERTSISSENFGCLPTPAAIDYFPPEGAITHLRASPRWVESGLRSYATHMPGERSYGDFRSVLAPAPVEEGQRYEHPHTRPVL